MTVQTDSRGIPEWTLGDRMGKALSHADMGVQEMADYLGVSRNTVSTWLHDRIRPSRQTQMLWAMRTGVALEWLTGEWAPRGSNPEPTVSGVHRRLYAVAV